MAIVRVIKNKDYTTISNIHLRDKNLSLKAKGLLTVMLSLPDNWDYSVQGLVSICKESKKAIQSTLQELEEYGYLIRKRINGELGRIDYEYMVFENPIDINNYSLDGQTVEPCTQEPRTQKGCTEKEPQLNTKELNTNKLNTKELNTKEKKGTSSSKEDSVPKEKIPYEEIVNMFNSICISYPKVTKISVKRKKHLRARCNDYSLEDFKTIFKNMEESNFLRGNNYRNWSATFDWVISSEDNMTKVFEGNYKNKDVEDTSKRYKADGSVDQEWEDIWNWQGKEG